MLAGCLRATVGYDAMSLRALNREPDVNHNLIDQRLGTKEELWRAAVDFGFGRLMRHMQGLFDPTLREQLRLAVCTDAWSSGPVILSWSR
jgi:AcrR family transcriptional regulator